MTAQEIPTRTRCLQRTEPSHVALRPVFMHRCDNLRARLALCWAWPLAHSGMKTAWVSVHSAAVAAGRGAVHKEVPGGARRGAAHHAGGGGQVPTRHHRVSAAVDVANEVSAAHNYSVCQQFYRTWRPSLILKHLQDICNRVYKISAAAMCGAVSRSRRRSGRWTAAGRCT